MSRKQIEIAGAVLAGLAGAGYAGLKLLAFADRRRSATPADTLADPMAELAAPVDARSRTIPTPDGGEIHLVESGDPAGPPIVLLHGITLSSAIWNHQLTDMAVAAEGAVQNRVIAVDLRGHGLSTAGRNGYGLDVLGDDLATLLESLDLSGAMIVGHSMGGMAIMHFCRRHSGVLYRRVNGIVFMSTAACDVGGGPNSPQVRLSRGFVERNPEAAARRYQALPGDLGYAVLRLGFGRRPSPVWVEQTRVALRAMSAEALGRSLVGLVDHDERKVLPSLDLPVLVLVGSRDVVTPPAQARQIAELVPGARLEEFEGAGHTLMLERREELAHELLAFATQCRPRQPKRAVRR